MLWAKKNATVGLWGRGVLPPGNNSSHAAVASTATRTTGGESTTAGRMVVEGAGGAGEAGGGGETDGMPTANLARERAVPNGPPRRLEVMLPRSPPPRAVEAAAGVEGAVVMSAVEEADAEGGHLGQANRPRRPARRRKREEEETVSWRSVPQLLQDRRKVVQLVVRPRRPELGSPPRAPPAPTSRDRARRRPAESAAATSVVCQGRTMARRR